MSIAVGIGISTSVFVEVPGGGPVSPSNLITEIGMTPPEDNIVTETGTQIVLEA